MKLGLFPVDRDNLRRDGLVLFSKLIRTKNVENLQEQAVSSRGGDDRKQKLTKCLTTLDLTSLGVGSCVGTGMYLVSGMVAKRSAGPGVIFSFIIAAVASIFSGACYAEFGVRVPHTTGSAYMYSYVTVGEFIAFVIGWNMILEYLIGTSACACALSACLDALMNGAISDAVYQSLGTIFGKSPDFLAFVITILMTLLLTAGVKKSLIFNNILNAINLAVWVFVMSAGLFYVKASNWTEHGGFLPHGWSGVFTGAATCFYAFIGFDIIATTGEEATNPKKSIPLAIITSLGIILTAYVTSSMMLTLIVPYTEVDENSALVKMFDQVGAYNCKYIVAIGAFAGLTVSMFGSMFPMPRVIYAMAQDGVIFRILAQVWPSTGTPAIATLGSGLAAALAALIISLDVLVEMMSIGTLLAYTLVSTCVLILRYQPHSTNLVELLPQSLRTPIKGSPTKETISQAPNGQGLYTNQLQPDALRQALDSNLSSQVPSLSPSPIPTQPTQRVMVRRITRSSPDSDDTYPGDQEDEFSMRDDQFLVSDRTENKFYGTLHGGGSTASTGGVIGSTVGPSMGYIGRRLQAATYLFPAIFPWVDTGPPTEESGMFVMKMVGLLYIFIIIFDLIIVLGMHNMTTATTVFLFLFFFFIIGVLLAISRKPQNRNAVMFMTPGLPFVPAIAVTVNIYLIFKLSYLTLVRFTIWMTLGFIMYFYYGIKHSTLEEGSEIDQNIELTVTDHGNSDKMNYQPQYTAATIPNYSTNQPQPVYNNWDTSWNQADPWSTTTQQWSGAPGTDQQFQVEQQYNMKSNTTRSVISDAAPQSHVSSTGGKGQGTSLFLSDNAFPTWDD
ncbi:probable cationic amino acid transporter [Agrilus planipennis]|uniref:Probable cationic amino acid transporter n=1 Tax=Agrilus planipennis TaxID=224129 RepID=A0A1W4WGI8_AGRPL|nr:probable cationic amino acid transporter [Agrilus planipennis]XP_018319577.1 probable cationic amino acid transporter [Agrilus planipennis]XP_018319578.1 probable cationic amino acid transporter [Agrilus planipennis]